MSVTIDANVLLYASDARSPRQHRAHKLLERLAAGPDLVYVFWPVVMAYLRITTHPGIFAHPLDPDVTRVNVGGLLRRPHVRCPGEGTGFWKIYEDTVDHDVIRGNLVCDAHIRHTDAPTWSRRHLDRRPGLPALRRYHLPRPIYRNHRVRAVPLPDGAHCGRD